MNDYGRPGRLEPEEAFLSHEEEDEAVEAEILASQAEEEAYERSLPGEWDWDYDH